MNQNRRSKFEIFFVMCISCLRHIETCTHQMQIDEQRANYRFTFMLVCLKIPFKKKTKKNYIYICIRSATTQKLNSIYYTLIHIPSSCSLKFMLWNFKLAKKKNIQRQNEMMADAMHWVKSACCLLSCFFLPIVVLVRCTIVGFLFGMFLD